MISLILAAAASGSAVPLAAPALRHLVFSYQAEVRSDSEYHYGGIGSGAPGIGTAWGGGTDKGTITADVVAVAQDGGLVIRISEKSSLDRSRFIDPVMCAVYGNTNVQCSANSAVSPEMYSLLRLLGRNFIVPANLDAKNHWQVQTGGHKGLKETSDFTVLSNDGGVAKIVEAIDVRDQDAIRQNEKTDGNIVYDVSMSVPKSVHEQTMSHPSTYTSVERTIDIQLQTDSFAHK